MEDQRLRIARQMIFNPRSSVFDPQSSILFGCSLLIHLFREKTGWKFSARSLESWWKTLIEPSRMFVAIVDLAPIKNLI
jgi:hypothetical protein